MKILVCVSKTPDTTSKISFTNDGKDFNEDGINFIMNPYDEWYALVRAIELKEQHGGTVSLVHVGDAASDIIIRKGLALGADDAYRINTNPTSAYVTAAQISNHAKEQGYDLIFLGKETIDYNGSEVGGMLAEFLDIPYASFVTNLESDGSIHTITREIEGGVEISKVEGPMVISAAKGLAEQRIANMMGIMQSKRKPLNLIEPIDVEDTISLIKHTLPEAKSGVQYIDPDNMEELVRRLHEEAKVI
jgi:electron transfer flavoprotein beta subunit